MATTYYFLPTRNLFGEDSVQEAGTLLQSLGGKKAMIVTDSFLATSGMAEDIQKILTDAGVESVIFGGAEPNPKDTNVEDGLEVFNESKCDSIISLGGGSSHDCAKAIALVVSNGGNIRDYEGVDKSKNPLCPMIAINDPKLMVGMPPSLTAAIRQLSSQVGIPENLRSLGVKEEVFEAMAENAMKDVCQLTNPRKATKEQIVEIFKAAY